MPVSHQTIKLEAGRHRGPEDGACVMELASMLAHEPFGDHPQSVCPVIAGFLRSYNDHIDVLRRQDLYPYAAVVVGTRADPVAERGRAELCLAWARDWCDRPPLRVRFLHRLLRCQGPDVDGVYAARAAAATPGAHPRALALVERLIAVGADPPSPERSSPLGARSAGDLVGRSASESLVLGDQGAEVPLASA